MASSMGIGMSSSAWNCSAERRSSSLIRRRRQLAGPNQPVHGHVRDAHDGGHFLDGQQAVGGLHQGLLGRAPTGGDEPPLTLATSSTTSTAPSNTHIADQLYQCRST